jgi:hypothetical protein
VVVVVGNWSAGAAVRSAGPLRSELLGRAGVHVKKAQWVAKQHDQTGRRACCERDNGPGLGASLETSCPDGVS